ncbi:phosphonopyruvate decarboxylase [Streptomyces physcomitrii]|uniref:Phosphonopyruvate decarboxylase n=2 Tax=Streptomyces TaxID=1883 RepID=A0A0B5EWK6_STRA4|nr:phosphonopyruvate decarboxylase [Streptomyces physcomitrii]AJE83600.1 phosphonopyruvate decarboxylase [Streptomyces albus]AOU77907.1 phosphonopyruvate decarboxylase [Streptomyces albus]AYN33662.1 phosphonopyruvate decarboxylase [Streptomyces albus]NKI41788.1 phosphonopyruvate decarboxylase [Streptomyces physcomitrii]
MISAQEFCDLLADRGFTMASGVPCSHFGGPIAHLSTRSGRYVPAPNEGSALAVAAGAALGGRRAYVMLQNSGLGNLINPLTSLVMTYQLPILTFASLRGWPDPATDEPQHAVMGPATPGLLDSVDTPHHTLYAEDGVKEFSTLLAAAEKDLAAQRAPFVLVERGAIGKATAANEPHTTGLPAAEAIRIVTAAAPQAAVVATTGFTGRDTFAVADSPGNFYMQGSMGHASSLGLGVALTHPERTVVVLDGDGALLMHLGALSMIGNEEPANLIHVVLDNRVHESTGGQATTSATTSFPEMAKAAGYASAVDCDGEDALRAAMLGAQAASGPHMICVKTLPRTGTIPPRATNALTTLDIRDRFQSNLQ